MCIRKIWTVFLLVGFCSIAHAQSDEGARWDAQGGVGVATFGVEGPSKHVLMGGRFQEFVFRGFNIGAETFYWMGPGNDRDVTIVPLAGYEFKRSAGVRPYVIGGIGKEFHSEGRFRTNGLTFGAGAGIKLPITDRFYVAPEFRLGFEPALRAGVNFGYRF
jgi:outer membrane protein with beta-barrel domain